MSTQKDKIKNPKLAKRTIESILAEAYICKKLNWKIEFLSGGYESYDTAELLKIFKEIKKIYGKKLWLNIGIIKETDLKKFLPYIEGVCGAVEVINPALQKQICPSKPLDEIEDFFSLAEKYRLKKAMTIILGLGENIDDFLLLKNFIKKHKIDKITFYRLKPQKNTPFENATPIEPKYYAEWVKLTREEFPKLQITVGSWLTYLDELSLLLNSGADNFTKFSAIKLFNSKYAKTIEKEVKKSKRILKSKLTGKLDFKIPKNLPYRQHVLQYISKK